MAPPILILRDIDLSFGGTPLLEGAFLSVSPGERPCLVGRNGSGKSTLLKIAAGLIEADGGERFVQPGTTLRYLPQEPDLSDYADVLSYVEAGLAPGDDPHRAAPPICCISSACKAMKIRLIYQAAKPGARHWPAYWRPSPIS